MTSRWVTQGCLHQAHSFFFTLLRKLLSLEQKQCWEFVVFVSKLCCHLFLCSFQEKLSRLLERHSKLILGCWLCFAMSFVKMFPHCFNNIEVWTNPWLIVLHFLFLFFWPFTALVHSFAFLVMLKREAVASQMLSGCYHMVDPNLSIHFCVHSSLLTRAQPLEPWQSLHCVGLLTPSVRLKSDLKLNKIMFQFITL